MKLIRQSHIVKRQLCVKIGKKNGGLMPPLCLSYRRMTVTNGEIVKG